MKYTERTYNPKDCRVFRKTKEEFGGLSNMCSGYPLLINGIKIQTSEALYQACRYPHIPEIQAEIIGQQSPMTAKMKSKAHYEESRQDWETIKVRVMRWCLAIKLAQNFRKFGTLIESTGIESIVEESRRDKFWGAKKTEDGLLIGINALGRLLMELRDQYGSKDRYNLLYVPPLVVDNFKLLGKDIGVVDERENFLMSLLNDWRKCGLPLMADVGPYFQAQPEENRVMEPPENTVDNLPKPQRKSDTIKLNEKQKKTKPKKTTNRKNTLAKDMHNSEIQSTQGQLGFPGE